MFFTIPLFGDLSSLALPECLRAMRFLQLKFSQIHIPFITKQVPNAHDTYLPISLVCSDGSLVNVKDLLVENLPQGDREARVPTHSQPCVIYGSKGSGKKSLLLYLNYQWILEAGDVKGIQDFDLVVLINAKKPILEGEKPSAKTVMRFLSRRLSWCYIPKCITQMEVLVKLSNMKILWLINGYQDAPEENKEAIEWVLRIMRNSKVVITCRFSHTFAIRNLMAKAGVTYSPVMIRPLTVDTWRLMVPKMMAAKTNNIALIREASEEYMSVFEDMPQLVPSVLATTINDWMELRYPHIFRQNRGIYRNCIDS